ncbi:MAG TPA: hypothetical protein VFN67_27730 [Polyangiales bacterium]|nr:hypothetical protein [Polyangiales bacterium]
MEQNERLSYLLALLLRDADVDAGLLYHVALDQRVRCVAVQLTAANDGGFDAQVAAFVGRLAAFVERVTMSVMAHTEGKIVRDAANGEPERFGAVMLRGTDNCVHGIALMRTPAPLLRTPGLATAIADVLAKTCCA